MVLPALLLPLAGPLVALAAGLACWGVARLAAPCRPARQAANDNAPLLSPALPRRASLPASDSGGMAMIGRKTDGRRGAAGALSVIGADVTITGNIRTEGDLHVDGTVEGDIACGSLVQGAASRIVGIVRAKAARLAGTIEGEVAAGELTVEKSARLRGDASYRALRIETGAQVDGRMTHLDADPAAIPDAPLRLVGTSEAAAQ